MFEKHKQKKYEATIANKDAFIKDLQSRLAMTKATNVRLSSENDKYQELLNRIADLSVAYPLGNEKIALDKIKELSREYQTTT